MLQLAQSSIRGLKPAYRAHGFNSSMFKPGDPDVEVVELDSELRISEEAAHISRQSILPTDSHSCQETFP